MYPDIVQFYLIIYVDLAESVIFGVRCRCVRVLASNARLHTTHDGKY